MPSFFKKHGATLLLVLVFLAGISLLLYPTVSDYWNGLHQSRAIAGYDGAVQELNQTDYERMLAEAQSYNEALRQNPARFSPTEAEEKQYEMLLNVSGTGIMGYVEIPKLGTKLPVYHGTDDAVLQIAIGHIEGSSLPVGGPGTHSVLSGHRGLPSAKLFTNLDQLSEGDVFDLHVLGDVLRYEVDQILVVLPQEMDALAIEEGQDYCTLITCTPYGVNTHRLLVRGHRIPVTDASAAGEGVYTQDDALEQSGWFQQLFLQIQRIPLPVVAAAAALLLLLLLLAKSGGGKSKKLKKSKRTDKTREGGEDGA